MAFRRNQIVERLIDDIPFSAVIVDIHPARDEVRIRYLDDGNIEDGVSVQELRICDDGSMETKDSGSVKNANNKQTHLAKPLMGLVDDDSEERLHNTGVAVVHESADTEEAIILNGAENRQAAGAGLRALRQLRNKDKTANESKDYHK